MRTVLLWLTRYRRRRVRARALGEGLDRVIQDRNERLKLLEGKIADTRTLLPFDVPTGPAGGAIYRAQSRLINLRADTSWVKAVRWAEFEIAVSSHQRNDDAAMAGLESLAIAYSEMEAEVEALMKDLDAVAHAGGCVTSSAQILNDFDAATVANMVLFAPDLSEAVFAGQVALAKTRSESTRQVADLLRRRRSHMRLCGRLPHRRQVSRDVRVQSESAALGGDEGSANTLHLAHRAVSSAMFAIHREQLDDVPCRGTGLSGRP